MTIRELFREFVAAKRRRKDEAQRDIALAWQCVRIYVMTQNKHQLPNLHELLNPGRERPAQSHAAMKTALQELSQQYGLPVIRH